MKKQHTLDKSTSLGSATLAQLLKEGWTVTKTDNQFVTVEKEAKPTNTDIAIERMISEAKEVCRKSNGKVTINF